MCVCDKERREEEKKNEKKKTRKEDFGGVYTVRESHINIFHITRSFLSLFCSSSASNGFFSYDSNAHYQRNENIRKQERKNKINVPVFSFLYGRLLENEIRKHKTSKKRSEQLN